MKALVIIDTQNDFISGPLGSPEAEDIVPRVCTLIKNRAYNDTILFFTQDTHSPINYLDTQEGKFLPIEHCIDNTEGWKINYKIYEAAMSVANMYDDIRFITKDTFGSLGLIDELAKINLEYDLDSVTLCGLCSDICVAANMVLIKTHFPEVPITVVERCCAGSTPERHHAAIETMKSLQTTVI